MYPSGLYRMAKRYHKKHKCSVRELGKIIGVSRDMASKLLQHESAPGYRRHSLGGSPAVIDMAILKKQREVTKRNVYILKQQHEFWHGHKNRNETHPDTPSNNSECAMLTIMNRIKIHHLAEAGIPQARISRLVGCSERSIRRVLDEPMPSPELSDSQWRANCGVGAPSKTVTIANRIASLLKDRPSLPTHEVLRQAREWGYQGGLSTFRKLIKDLRPDEVLLGPLVDLDRDQNEFRNFQGSEDEYSDGVKYFGRQIGASFGIKWLREVCLSNFRTLTVDDITSRFSIKKEVAASIIDSIKSGCSRRRRTAFVIISHLENVSNRHIALIANLARDTVGKIVSKYKRGCPIDDICKRNKTKIKKEDNKQIQLALFSILHSPPKIHGFVRTTWRQVDLKAMLKRHGISVSHGVIGQIIKKAGFRYKQARQVLTSNDPNYQEKLAGITNILNKLQPDEKFFSIDEYGPFAVKVKGGRSLMAQGEQRIFQQFQKSKGWLIMTAAIELSTNQVTHFYSRKKNTDEMIKLLDMLLVQYGNQKTIYLSWDAASWHASKKLYDYVELLNSDRSFGKHPRPVVKLAPLPARAQFLNVIEAVFSGMSRAIIHNSDYQSVVECMAAIDRYFEERNAEFRENPKRAGNKIWGKEPILAKFDAANNCKDPKYCR